MTTITNPLDISYRYSDLSVGPFYRAVFREAADPSLILFNDHYYVFPSMSGGFWHSDDLAHWAFAATKDLPIYDYAPDVREIDGYLVVCASRASKPCSFYRTKDPINGPWEEIPGTLNFFDPSLFQDDDGRVYLFWGTSNKKPIQGQELDRQTFRPIGERASIISSDITHHGWERPGQNNDAGDNNMGPVMKVIGGTAPYIEGAWITKHADTYYLQYAAPGTQVNVYADGYYTSRSPLGPYTYSPHSPFSSKPGGFINGAGHGSTIQDRHGNWWHTSTMAISVHQMFERRMALWPAGFDDDGVLFCNQEFGDWPLTIPSGPADPWSLTAKELLVSYGRPVTVSSSVPGHGPELVTDENARTWWVAGTDRPGEWATVSLAPGTTVTSIQVNIADHDVRPRRPKFSETTQTLVWRRKIDLSEPLVEALVEVSTDGTSWETLLDTRGSGLSRTHLSINLETPREIAFVKVTGFSQPYGSSLALSGIRVFGRGSGEPPEATKPTARRSGPLNAALSWPMAIGALGYNIRYGLAADKLYSSWLVYGKASHDLTSLNAGHDYWIAVDSFNENGITRGEPVRVTGPTR